MIRSAEEVLVCRPKLVVNYPVTFIFNVSALNVILN